MMARSLGGECRKQLCLTQNPLFNDPPRKREGYRGKLILKRPRGTRIVDSAQKIPNTSATAGRKPFRSRSGKGNVSTKQVRRKSGNYQARNAVAAKFFHVFTASSVGRFAFFDDANSCQGVIKQKSRVSLRYPSCQQKLQQRSTRGNWGTE